MLHTSAFPALATAFLLTATGAQAESAADTAAPEPTAAVELQEQESQNPALVTVNGQVITAELFSLYLSERAQRAPGGKPSPQLQNQVINELINTMLLSQAAHAAGMDTRPDVVMAMEFQRNQALSRLMLQEQLSKAQPSEEELKSRYEAQYATPGDEYKARHILVKTEEEAKKILAELEQGKDFNDLAKQYSQDPASKNGGDLGWFGPDQMVKPFADAVRAMTPGTISEAPVQSPFGWHIIKLEEKRTATPPTFETVRRHLLAELQRKAMTDYLNQLRAEAKIEVNEAFAKATPSITPAP